MGVGVVIEPLVVVTLLFGGTWINREPDLSGSLSRQLRTASRRTYADDDNREDANYIEAGMSTYADKDGVAEPRASPSLLLHDDEPWRERKVGIGPWECKVYSPNSEVFRWRLLSRVLRWFPFLVECWYWALVYWTYQLGRAFTALTLKDDTVDVARAHALQVVRLEQALGLFWEVDLQKFLLRHPQLMTWTNWTYSFIHIPGTIAFLVWLYYYTTPRNSLDNPHWNPWNHQLNGSPAGPRLYAARRRTLAVCNLLAFIVFTLWPCMPPRLLSDASVPGEAGELARRYGFVDTVHRANGASSVWTHNRFCNQYAAMPSLHFGYSLMIGLTVMTIPLPRQHRQSRTIGGAVFHLGGIRIWLPSWRRLVCVSLGLAYPLVILTAILATANHFILDAVAGAIVCLLGWWGNAVLLNLLPVEDYFLWVLRLHKPERQIVDNYERVDDPDDQDIVGHGVLIH